MKGIFNQYLAFTLNDMGQNVYFDMGVFQLSEYHKIRPNQDQLWKM